MNSVCFLCESQIAADVSVYFCPDCKNSFETIEIEIDDELILPLSVNDRKRLQKSNLIRKQHSSSKSTYIGLVNSQATPKMKQSFNKTMLQKIDGNVKLKISAEEQDSLKHLDLVNRNYRTASKLNRKSKKIHKTRYSHLDQMDSGRIETERNYSSLGNNKYRKMRSDSEDFAPLSRDTTDPGSNEHVNGSPQRVSQTTEQHKTNNNQTTLLNPVELLFDSSDDSDIGFSTTTAANPGQKSNKKTPEFGKRKNSSEIKSTNSDSVDQSISLMESEQNDYFIGSVLSLPTNKDGTFKEQELCLSEKNGKSSSKNNEEDASTTDEIMIGPEHQCIIPELLNPSQPPTSKRNFKMKSDPTVIDAKALEVVEQYVQQHLKIQNISQEKLLRWLREVDYQIPNFFCELLKDKENAQRRLMWKKERRLL